MVITPSSYDPFTSNISFVQLNKQRRHELDRQPTAQRIYNNFYVPQTIRMRIIHNGDVHSKPKLFVWRKWKGGELSDLLEEAGRHLGSEVSSVYTEDGELIKKPSQISGNRTYVFTGAEPFDYRTVDSFNRLTPIQQQPVVSLVRQNRPVKQPVSKFSRKNLYEFDQEAMNRSPPRIYSSRLPTISDDYSTHKTDEDTASYQLSIQNSNASVANSGNQINLIFKCTNISDEQRDEEAEISDMFAELELKDQAMLARHRQKFAGRRNTSANIYNRKDQSHLIYVFLNGDGLNCQHINFTTAQVNSGMDSILETIAQKLNVAPGRLVDMDGRKIRDVYQVDVSRCIRFNTVWPKFSRHCICSSNQCRRHGNKSAENQRTPTKSKQTTTSTRIKIALHPTNK
ncbi:Doublecortin domain-containing protein [Aphelenchoides bicaudatus]|nr:Doublecortin domain-containing protein [Aphelenchoides bicaudatus]